MRFKLRELNILEVEMVAGGGMIYSAFHWLGATSREYYNVAMEEMYNGPWR